MDAFELELKNDFLQEASQLLEEAEKNYLDLEANPSSNHQLINEIFRLVHNLKGSSKAVGFDELGSFTHEFESLLNKIKNNEVPISASTVSLLLRCNDHVKAYIRLLRKDIHANMDGSSLIADILQLINGGSQEGGQAKASSGMANTNDHSDEDGDDHNLKGLSQEHPIYQIHAEDPESKFLYPHPSGNEASSGAEGSQPMGKVHEIQYKGNGGSNQLASLPQPSPSYSSEGGGNPKSSPNPNGEESIRISLARLDKLIDYVGELVVLQSVLRQQSEDTNHEIGRNRLKKNLHQMDKVTKEIQDISMGLRMLPLKQTFQKMQRIVRDTSQLLDKRVQFRVSGEDTEVDKTVLEHLNDPLVHIIRNAVDHGIESAEERKALGKPEMGYIQLRAYHQSSLLIIEISDDGKGLDPDKLVQKALEKGLLVPGTEVSREEALQIIFHPGFSTKTVATEVSGRGIGMDVVKSNIERLQGEVQIETELGKGTTFKIILPLTLAIIDGLIVQSGLERYVVPLSHVHETVKPSQEELKKSSGLGHVLLLRGETIPMYFLSDLLGKKNTTSPPSPTSSDQNKSQKANRPKSDGIAIVMKSPQETFSVLVGDILDQSQVVVKKLGEELRHIKGFSGCTILGDGRPAIILEIPDMINQLTKGQNRKKETIQATHNRGLAA